MTQSSEVAIYFHSGGPSGKKSLRFGPGSEVRSPPAQRMLSLQAVQWSFHSSASRITASHLVLCRVTSNKSNLIIRLIISPVREDCSTFAPLRYCSFEEAITTLSKGFMIAGKGGGGNTNPSLEIILQRDFVGPLARSMNASC
jgi:hypothetical protein